MNQKQKIKIITAPKDTQAAPQRIHGLRVGCERHGKIQCGNVVGNEVRKFFLFDFEVVYV
jgi:hypothetical protein